MCSVLTLFDCASSCEIDNVFPFKSSVQCDELHVWATHRQWWREFDHVFCFKSEHSWHARTVLVVVLLLVLVVLALVASIWFDTLVVLEVL